jgi:hypothetical protein
MEFVKDNSNWPLVVYTIKGDINSKNKKTFDEFLTSWSEMYLKSCETNQKFSLFLDVTHLGTVSPGFVITIANFLKKCKQLTELWMEKTAIFIDGGIIKSILDFVFMVYKPVRPFKIFNEKKEAITWVLNGESGDEKNY